jgi:hypothetical protein
MEQPLRAALFMMVAAVAADCAQAGSLQVAGTAGYLSEWELDGAVSERTSAGVKEFFGALTWKHVGLCSPNGPQEKSGNITFQISGSGASSEIHATLSLDGVACAFSKKLADQSVVFMDCSDAKGVPLALSFK